MGKEKRDSARARERERERERRRRRRRSSIFVATQENAAVDRLPFVFLGFFFFVFFFWFESQSSMNMTSVSTSGGVKVVKLVRVCGARMRTTSRASCSFNTSLSTPLTTQALDLRVKRVANTSGRTRCVTRALFGGGTMEPLPALKEIKLKDIENRPIKAETYLNKVLLVVNVASNCGFTASNYKDLVELHKRYEGKDFEILAFPCNQFGGQEPGSNEQIKEFTRRYGVEFPVTEKVDVNGPNTHPFFKYSRRRGQRASW